MSWQARLTPRVVQVAIPADSHSVVRTQQLRVEDFVRVVQVTTMGRVVQFQVAKKST